MTREPMTAAALLSQQWAEDHNTLVLIQRRIDRLALEYPRLTFSSAATVEESLRRAGLSDE